MPLPVPLPVPWPASLQEKPWPASLQVGHPCSLHTHLHTCTLERCLSRKVNAALCALPVLCAREMLCALFVLSLCSFSVLCALPVLGVCAR